MVGLPLPGLVVVLALVRFPARRSPDVVAVLALVRFPARRPPEALAVLALTVRFSVAVLRFLAMPVRALRRLVRRRTFVGTGSSAFEAVRLG